MNRITEKLKEQDYSYIVLYFDFLFFQEPASRRQPEGEL
jgi:hypothetical protein